MSRQAYSLDVFLAELNRHAPNRSKVSDGGLASPEHHQQNPDSDHEPNAAGVWRARDVTHDPAHGMDCNDLARRVAALLGKHPALMSGAYVIWNRRIISTNRLREGWRPYAGSNPHTKHAHVSVATETLGYDSTRPWNLWEKGTPELDAAIDHTQNARWKRKRGTWQWVQLGLALRILRAVRDAAKGS